MKGAIDSRIAEEQARQRNAQYSPSRSASSSKRPTSRNRAASPAVRAARPKPTENKSDSGPQKGPDPKEFEPEFIIEDEDTMSRTGTPKPVEGKDEGGPITEATAEIPIGQDGERQVDEEKMSEQAAVDAALELPTDVRVKLRKLERLESRYQGRHTFFSRSNT